MPRTTKFQVGDLCISTSPRGNWYSHNVYIGDIFKVIRDEMQECYLAEIVKPGAKSKYVPGDVSNYSDEGVRKLQRSDLIELYKTQAAAAIEEAKRKMRIADLWQKYPTINDEIVSLIDRIMDGEITEERLEQEINDLSFSVKAVEPPPIDDYMSDLQGWR